MYSVLFVKVNAVMYGDCGSVTCIALQKDVELSPAGYQEIQVGVLEIEPLAQVKIGKRSLEEVDTAPDIQFMPYHIFKAAIFRHLKH